MRPLVSQIFFSPKICHLPSSRHSPCATKPTVASVEQAEFQTCRAVRAGNIELGEANGSSEGTEHFVVIDDFFNNQTFILQLLRHVSNLIALAVTLILSQRVPCLCTLWSFRNP